VKKLLSVLGFLATLYLFFLCIEMMGGAFKLFGKETAEQLLVVTSNPIIGLLIGILATSLMQSSSTTTSIIVGMAATGSLTLGQAIPIVMGANIGTTVTNALVSMGHIRRRGEFELAFSGAVVHDFFNLLAVALFLPLEIVFHPIERSAQAIGNLLMGVGGATFNSPLKAIVKPVVQGLFSLGKQVTDDMYLLGGVFVALSFALLVFALSRMVAITRGAMAKKIELIVDKYLFTSTARAFVIGALITALVQSSSVTTSIVVPMLGAGIVRLEQAYPYMLGANIGTTITAILASLVTGSPVAVMIALSHLLFNLFATAVFLPLSALPIGLARWLGRATAKRRWIAPAFVITLFFLVPGLLLFVT
jgi:solute carrier family 34 (sodium-dependent phosphate cotransporter)